MLANQHVRNGCSVINLPNIFFQNITKYCKLFLKKYLAFGISEGGLLLAKCENLFTSRVNSVGDL